jgi:hypothetical protein
MRVCVSQVEDHRYKQLFPANVIVLRQEILEGQRKFEIMVEVAVK